MNLTPQQIFAWQATIMDLAIRGVKSWAVIKAMLLDAGVAKDDGAIEILRVKWDVLVADVRRAAGL